MRSYNDLTWLRIGKIRVISRVEGQWHPAGKWACRCRCGRDVEFVGIRLLLSPNRCRSCGCSSWRENFGKPDPKWLPPFDLRSSTHASWAGAIQRCTNVRSAAWPYYGARGIDVCLEWRASFGTFLDDMGWKPNRDLSLDRIDVDGPYCKSNCRWATDSEQMSNTRRNVNLEFRGETLNLKQWADRLGMSAPMLRYRVLTWGVERAFTAPKDARGRRRSAA